MCGRYTLTKAHPELEGRFDFKASGFDWVPRYNIAPTQPVLTVLNNGGRNIELLQWGLVPSWSNDPSIGRRMINARAETVSEKPSFRVALRRRRCLILADGYYEWEKVADRRSPMYVRLKSGEAFAFAGLWDVWRSPSAELVRSCTIITTAANALMEPIHDRMPAILSRQAEHTWLDPRVEEPLELARLLVPYPEDEMETYSISTFVNSPRNDTLKCIRPLTSPPY